MKLRDSKFKDYCVRAHALRLKFHEQFFLLFKVATISQQITENRRREANFTCTRISAIGSRTIGTIGRTRKKEIYELKNPNDVGGQRPRAVSESQLQIRHRVRRKGGQDSVDAHRYLAAPPRQFHIRQNQDLRSDKPIIRPDVLSADSARHIHLLRRGEPNQIHESNSRASVQSARHHQILDDDH